MWKLSTGSVGDRNSLGNRAVPSPPALTPVVHGQFTEAKTFAGKVGGYCFTTRGGHTGYYRDLPSLGNRAGRSRQGDSTHSHQPSARCVMLNDLTTSSDAFCNTMLDGGLLRRPTRHVRLANGTRRRGGRRDARRKHEASLGNRAGLVDPIDAPHADLADDWWKDQGLWAFDTANTNSWATATQSVLARSAADVLFLQETRIIGAAGTKKATKDARALGWSCCPGEALRTAANRASGGNAIAAKKGTGITPHDGIVADGFGHRIHVAHVSAVVRGGVHCGSIYLKFGEGLSIENMEILQQAEKAISHLRGPWVFAGDWNITPQMLVRSGWLKAVGGTVVAPVNPTCHNAIYDFFVVSDGLVPAVEGVMRIEDAGLSPHWPSRLLLRADGRRPKVRQLRKPPRISARLPHGPAPKPPCYDKARPTVVTQEAADCAMNEWYTAARTEWGALTGTPVGSIVPSFVWAPAAGPVATPHAGSTLKGSLWRGLARRLEEVANLLSLGNRAEQLGSEHQQHHLQAPEEGGRDPRSVACWR